MRAWGANPATHMHGVASLNCFSRATKSAQEVRLLDASSASLKRLIAKLREVADQVQLTTRCAGTGHPLS